MAKRRKRDLVEFLTELAEGFLAGAAGAADSAGGAARNLWTALQRQLPKATLPERARIDAMRSVLVAQGALEVALSLSNVDLAQLKQPIGRALTAVDEVVWAFKRAEGCLGDEAELEEAAAEPGAEGD